MIDVWEWLTNTINVFATFKHKIPMSVKPPNTVASEKSA